MERKKIILIVIAVFTIICVYFIFEFFVWNLDKEEVINNEENYVVDSNHMNDSDSKDDEQNMDNTVEDKNESSSNSNEAIEDNDLNEKIYVYVTGEVNKNGVVILNEGARISDAIDAAGGITSNADISKINLVYILSDGVKLNIPSFEDLKENPDFEYIILGSGEGNLNSENITSSNENSSKTGSDNNEKTGSVFPNQVVNINSASQTELELLPRYWSFTSS